MEKRKSKSCVRVIQSTLFAITPVTKDQLSGRLYPFGTGSLFNVILGAKKDRAKTPFFILGGQLDGQLGGHFPVFSSPVQTPLRDKKGSKSAKKSR